MSAREEMMRGNWHTIVGAVKEKFGEISGDELTRVKGNYDQFVGLLQRKAGQTREQVESFLEECCDGAGGTLNAVADRAAVAAQQAGDYLHDAYENLSEGAGRGYDYARDTVARRPFESVAIVAGVALLMGLLLGISLGNRK